MREVLGVGHVYWYPRRKPHYDDEVCFTVQKMVDLVDVVVPWLDEHLPPSCKREQYVEWRAALLDYWEHHARKPRKPCSVEGCELMSRGKGLCHRHYYRYLKAKRLEADSGDGGFGDGAVLG